MLNRIISVTKWNKWRKDHCIGCIDFVNVILSIEKAFSQYVLCLFIKVSETKRKDGSTQNRIQCCDFFVSPKPISSPIIICGAPRTLESPLFDKNSDKLSRYWHLLEHKSLSTSGIHRFGVDVQVRLKKDCYLHLFPIINVIFCFFFHCLSHQVSHNDGC